MKIKSAFEHKGQIPSEYTCDGQDKIPALEISEVPAEAKSLALIMDDPDAPMRTWDHWIQWNIPPNTKKIDKDIGTPGKNSWGRTGYGGPCPPSGTHRYYFKLYALDTMLDLPAGSDKKALESAMKGHILKEAVLMGKYQRTS
ncbi:YbhB/YbcL family Raf kinase inhibitor-like protein [Candidatus Woesearchaeota archaeon]|nr:YbhB/YbcL family Raf kinase inhibitor-like protein [Candidatus Woesearchaeota archaeon]MBW3016299.1 YbhB/YbcL family Raf kinase inhibitor-like protein [Candidatus Woesearchaeota archaeon]